MGRDCFLIAEFPAHLENTRMQCSSFRLALPLLATLAGELRVSAVTLDVDTILGPDHAYTNETITVVDGVTPPTRIDVLDGALIGGPPSEPAVPIGVDVHGQSIVTMFGGRIKGRDQSVLLHDQSVFRMFDGMIRTSGIDARDSSRVILDGGDWGGVDAYDSSRVRVNGGDDESTFSVQTFGAAHAAINANLHLDFIADESSTMVINSGRIEIARALGSSEVLVNGGHFATGLNALDNALLRIRRIDDISEETVDISDNAVAHVYGTNLRFEVTPENRQLVRGTWPDGGNLAFRYRLQQQGQIILHEVPEPGSWALLAVGSTGMLWMRRAAVVAAK